MFDNLTLVIPTKNRHYYLERILDYYTNSRIKIIVADASSEKYIKNLPQNVTYQHYPDVPYCQKLDDVFSKITTTYSLLCADDDFIIPNAIQECVSFLSKNPDYNSAQGHYLFFYHSKNKLFYTPGYLSTIGCDFNEGKARDRVSKFNKTGIQFYYCVHKTETLKNVFRYANNKFFNLNIVELLMGMSTVIDGKHKVLPIFYSVRELLYSSAGKSTGLNVFSVSEDYKEQYQAFFDETARLLATKEHISPAEATAFLKESIQNHIHYRYSTKFSLKKTVITFTKKVLPLKLRKHVRHYSLLLKKTKKEKNDLAIMKKIGGFPTGTGNEQEELKRIEGYILKYNIHQK